MQIFLSHATSDQDLVKRVKAAIGSRAAVYCTEDDVQAGVNVHEKIQAQISNSDLMIVLLSDVGATSIYLHQEIGFAKSAGKLIIPLVSGNVASRQLGMLEGIEHIQINESTDWLTRLSARLEGIVKADSAQRSKVEQDKTNVLIGVVAIAAVMFFMAQS